MTDKELIDKYMITQTEYEVSAGELMYQHKATYLNGSERDVYFINEDWNIPVGTVAVDDVDGTEYVYDGSGVWKCDSKEYNKPQLRIKKK